jgi:hypothetical protein
MTKIAVQPNESGSGTFTLTAPNTDTSYTLTLPQSTGTFLTNGNNITSLNDVYSSMSPTDGQVLTYDTTNGWQAENVPAGGIANVVEDTTPELGGSLDAGSNNIYFDDVSGTYGIGFGLTRYIGKISGSWSIDGNWSFTGTNTFTQPQTFTDITVNGPVRSNIEINNQTGTTYTTVLNDRSKLVMLDNASAVTVTIPTNTSVGYAIGTKIDLLARGAGQVTIAGDSGVTVNTAQTLKLRAQWSAASLIKLDTNEWVLVGDLEESP